MGGHFPYFPPHLQTGYGWARQLLTNPRGLVNGWECSLLLDPETTLKIVIALQRHVTHILEQSSVSYYFDSGVITRLNFF